MDTVILFGTILVAVVAGYFINRHMVVSAARRQRRRLERESYYTNYTGVYGDKYQRGGRHRR